MLIHKNSVLAKMAKIMGENTHEAFKNAEALLLNEFHSTQHFGLETEIAMKLIRAVRPIEDLVMDEVDLQTVVYLGPFGYKHGNRETFCSIEGAATIKPEEGAHYEYAVPLGMNPVSTLKMVRDFYEGTTYVERYQQLFGFVSDEKNAKRALTDFTNLYFGNTVIKQAA